MTERVINFYTDSDGAPHIRVDAPGERAVSAPVGDPMSFVALVAEQLDLEVDDSDAPDRLVISIPPGA